MFTAVLKRSSRISRNFAHTTITNTSTTKSIINQLRMTSSLSVDALKQWKQDLSNDLNTRLAATVLQNANADDVLVSRDQTIKNLNLFSDQIKQEGAPVTNQKSSGRCWLFAATNILRLKFYEKYNLKEFQLSPSYLFFYDKLEKANFFLDQIIETHQEPVDSRLIQYLLTDPVCDGGQYDMFTNIINKYGIVPNTVFPDSYNTLASRKLNYLITTKLREFAEVLREKLAKGESVEEIKVQQVQEIHRLLVIFLGAPPSPNDEIVWEYYDKDSKYHSLKSTPLKFLTEVAEYDASTQVSLLNDPRNPYERMIKIDRLGNVSGSKIVSYLNMPNEVLTKAIIKRIRENKPVFFGSHTPLYMNKKKGIMDVDLWDYKLIGYEEKQQKASRLVYHQSLMTHAMVITAVHVDEDGNAVRYRVENSWGPDSGNKGYYVMTQDYFEQHCYQIVVDKHDIEEYVNLLDSEPIVLPPYDPCGALAVCGKEIHN